MINPFPDLLTYSHLAPLILRVVVGSFFVFKAGRMIHRLYFSKNIAAPSAKTHAGAWLSLFGGISVFVGFYTQIGALVLFAIALYRSRHDAPQRIVYHLLAAIALSLLFTGAGFLAFDIPL